MCPQICAASMTVKIPRSRARRHSSATGKRIASPEVSIGMLHTFVCGVVAFT